jgi:hypothetical protein
MHSNFTMVLYPLTSCPYSSYPPPTSLYSHNFLFMHSLVLYCTYKCEQKIYFSAWLHVAVNWNSPVLSMLLQMKRISFLRLSMYTTFSLSIHLLMNYELCFNEHGNWDMSLISNLFCYTGVWAQGLVLVRQALLSHASCPPFE